MSSAYIAIQLVLLAEGGYVDDPEDKGGETKFGISKRQYPDLDIKDLTPQAAIEIYKRDYWNPIYEQINNQNIANYVFDIHVNSGAHEAGLIFQRALQFFAPGIKVDGIIGEQTIHFCNEIERLMNQMDNNYGKIACWILDRMKIERTIFLAELEHLGKVPPHDLYGLICRAVK